MALSEDQKKEYALQKSRSDADLQHDVTHVMGVVIDYVEGFYPKEDFDEDGDPKEEDKPMLWARAVYNELTTRPSLAHLRSVVPGEETMYSRIQATLKSSYTLTDDELDTLIQTHFNKPDFSSVAAYEWSHDTSDTNHVRSAAAREGGLDYKEIQQFITMKKVPQYPIHWSTLLGELARRGIVPEGNYIIKIC